MNAPSAPHSVAFLSLLLAWVGLMGGAPGAVGAGAAADARGASGLRDKTLVVWAAPANLTQQGGSALTLDDGASHFDGVVFGEITAGRWMPGSDQYRRTQRDQGAWPAETAEAGTFVALAIAYRDQEVTVFRNGTEYARYTAAHAPVEFGPDSVVLFGRRHLGAGDAERSFAGRIREARIYDRALTAEEVRGLQPGRPMDGLVPWAWWAFGDEGLRDKTGRFTDIQLLGDVRMADGCLVLGGRGATVVMRATNEAAGRALTPKSWSAKGPVPDAAVQSARLLRERFLGDPYRPRYHFCVPEDMGMPGDPNGAFYAAGRYHLMYLYSRSGSGFCWGHVSSQDLVHWRHHPDAIGPGGGDEGCFSGGAFVDDDGTAWLSYWMLWGAKGIGLARGSGPAFDTWTKHEANPVIRSTEWGITEVKAADGRVDLLGSADPSNIWKQDGRYHVLTGNLLVLNKVGRAPEAPASAQGDRLYLWTSRDLKTWEYRHVLYERNPAWTDRSEDNMCPSFLPLPSAPEGGSPSGKHLMVFISHNKGCQYYLGTYRDDRFAAESHGRMTWVDNTYFAPEALIDGRGRQILWSWLLDNPAGEKEKGWSGVYGLPRTLWLGNDGTLRMRPVPELEALRADPRSWPSGDLGEGGGDAAGLRLDGVSGDACELAVELRPGTARECGVRVRASAGGEEQTLLYYDVAARELVFDATRSGGDGRRVVEKAPLVLPDGEPLRLRVFVDRSVVEVFANDRQAITRRVYPVRADSLGVSLFARGGTAKVESARGWTMMPSNPY